jgi:hypothetical protein
MSLRLEKTGDKLGYLLDKPVSGSTADAATVRACVSDSLTSLLGQRSPQQLKLRFETKELRY